MPDDHDITVEPVAGLPEAPPPGEEVLWQGRPDTWALAKDALLIRWVIGYFVVLTLYRVGAATADVPLVVALGAAVPPIVAGLVAFAVLYAMAWVMARATVYTVTTRRVAMRIGAALTLTLNLPFRQIASAGLDLKKDGTGTIAFKTLDGPRLSYLACWPHVKPGYVREPEPALRCIPDAERIAQMIAEAAETRLAEPVIERRVEAAAMAAE